ncbi:hypothetical protein DFH09DRAFT_1080910 [Mycena vulgaris]|nr:hypothetical protein DFH09DRAFT_1080910 [Mycena vulgaris]
MGWCSLVFAYRCLPLGLFWLHLSFHGCALLHTLYVTQWDGSSWLEAIRRTFHDTKVAAAEAGCNLGGGLWGIRRKEFGARGSKDGPPVLSSSVLPIMRRILVDRLHIAFEREKRKAKFMLNRAYKMCWIHWSRGGVTTPRSGAVWWSGGRLAVNQRVTWIRLYKYGSMKSRAVLSTIRRTGSCEGKTRLTVCPAELVERTAPRLLIYPVTEELSKWFVNWPEKPSRARRADTEGVTMPGARGPEPIDMAAWLNQ